VFLKKDQALSELGHIFSWSRRNVPAYWTAGGSFVPPRRLHTGPNGNTSCLSLKEIFKEELAHHSVEYQGALWRQKPF
jgi:hypothetical protein